MVWPSIDWHKLISSWMATGSGDERCFKKSPKYGGEFTLMFNQRWQMRDRFISCLGQRCHTCGRINLKVTWTWRDMWPSMVTHTRNLCYAFNPSKVHTHSSEHTPGAVGSHLCCCARGAVGGSVPCSRAPQSWYWGWRESAVHSLPPPTIPAGPETRTRNLWVTSPTL